MRTGNKDKILMAIVMTFMSVKAFAIDYISVDPLWELAVINGTDEVNKQYKTQTTKLIEIGALENTMALHFNAIKEWQRKYNSYLKTASYAEAVNAGSKLATSAVRTLRDIMDLKKAMSRNPEGIAATLAMNDLYLETIVEFIKTFWTAKYVLMGEKPTDEPLPFPSPVITPDCVVTTVTIQNNSNKDIIFDGKVCFVLYGTNNAGDYTGYMRIKGLCSGGDSTIPKGGSVTYTVVFEDAQENIGKSFAGNEQSGQYQSNNCIYIGGSGFTCKNIDPGTTFQSGGSYTMTVERDTHEWTSGAGGDSMLTGKERVDMIWELVDRLDELDEKIHKLTLSVAYYRVKDIWAFYTRGMFERHKEDIALDCLDRWNRVQDAMSILN